MLLILNHKAFDVIYSVQNQFVLIVSEVTHTVKEVYNIISRSVNLIVQSCTNSKISPSFPLFFGLFYSASVEVVSYIICRPVVNIVHLTLMEIWCVFVYSLNKFLKHMKC